MSCGGANDGSGRSTGFGGLVSATATQYGVKVSDARKYAHGVISERRQNPDAYPDPTQEEVVAVLDAAAQTLTRGRDRYDRPADGKTSDLTNSEKMWVRWNGYREAVAAERDKHARGEKKLPGGVEFSVWRDIPALMRNKGSGYRCASCGEFASHNSAHTCPATAAEQQAITVDLLALEKKRNQALGITAPERTAQLVSVGASSPAVATGQAITPTSVIPTTSTGGAPAIPNIDDQPVGATTLGGMTVGELKQWIRASQAYAFAAGQNSAPASTQPAPPPPAPPGSGALPPTPTPSYAPPAPPAPAPAVKQQKTSPARAWLRRTWRRLTGKDRCSVCGQFTGEGGHACPGPSASTTTAGAPPVPPGAGQPVGGPIPEPPTPAPTPTPQPAPPYPPVTPDASPPISGRDRAALGWGIGWRASVGVGALALTAGTVFAPFMLAVAAFSIWRAWQFRSRYLDSIGA